MIKLEDLRPKTGKFKLSATGNDYILRPFSVLDEIWLRNEYGDSLPELFNENFIDGNALGKIAYHQLEDKSDFKQAEVTDYDESGLEVVKKIGGYKRLVQLIHGMEEKIAILLAINETLGVSRPVIDKLAEEQDSKKKEK